MTTALITGASGLLGQCLVRQCPADASVMATGRTASGGAPVALDPSDVRAAEALVRQHGVSHIINCAAIRSPDTCRDNPDAARAANAGIPQALAAVATATGATFVHISTDYVFDGANPPYAEEARPNPVNVYGLTKQAGEDAARVAPHHLIVRIPAQFRADLSDPRNVSTIFARRLREQGHLTEDAVTVRYYTLADDTADAIWYCIRNGVTGTIHLTSDEKTSKAGLARTVAGWLGLPADSVTDGPIDVSTELRPLDSHLDGRRYRTMGGPVLRGVASTPAPRSGGAG